MYNELAQRRQDRFEFAPDPPRQIFAGRIFQARNVVEITMIELLEQRRERRLHVGKVHHPTRFGARLTFYMDFDAKRVSV